MWFDLGFFLPALCELPVLFIFMQVLDNGVMVKIEKKYLLEISADLVGLVEPVSDLEVRLNLLSNAPAAFSELDC